MSETSTERDQLIPPSNRPGPGSEEAETTRGGGAGLIKRLDLLPQPRDRAAMYLLGIGIALFLPLTWYLVFSQDLKALGWFAPHPLLQSLAITAFLLAIFPLQPPTPSSSAVRTSRFQLHQRWMYALALPALAVGTAAMWWNKHVHGAPHFTTWHSWFGAATVIWVLLQAALGSAASHFGGKLLGGPARAKKVYKYHRLSGYLLVAMLVGTAHLGGAHSTWALTRPGGEMKWVRVGAFWVGLPLLALGLYMRIR
ncbi:uncharacterized protein MKK02DRAFT_24354 [Dioszegia hungarica]|uniref:Cytochrome b561 domain-containing protein n=1 Tax=Dioszegia hungarica TaxID=4972 RepID=A0AA38HBS0_9TREE|nr:uncharacterized protein MKK02DRAFT_24354 [Dioszegia hungarica]KAI9637237.1 hypothetical protein MKK02DRAFT_24354 [Dioszegia hungarica]